MFLTVKTGLALAVVVAGAGMVCPPCREAPGAGTAVPSGLLEPADTAQVRLHISGMTCGSCPTTARVALKRLQGVYSATVTLDDSLGLVRYDPDRVTPVQIRAHLQRLTGYVATVLPDSATAPSMLRGG